MFLNRSIDGLMFFVKMKYKIIEIEFNKSKLKKSKYFDCKKFKVN